MESRDKKNMMSQGARIKNHLLKKDFISSRLIRKVSQQYYYRLFAPSPTVARIEITNRCNLTCRMCLHQSLKETGDMDFKTFKKIVNILPKSVIGINPTGFGEPLLHKNIIDIVEFSRSKHKYFTLFTNATTLDTKMAKNLLASGLSELHFSIDGTTKKTYEYLRLGANYDKVIQQISEFMSLRKKIQTPPRVVMRTILWKKNLQETTKFIELAKKLEIRHIKFQALQDFQGTALSKPEHSIICKEEINKVKEIFNKAQKKANKFGIKIRLPTVEFSNKILCFQPWHLLFVNWQGFVKPCCAVYDVNVGNLLNQPLKKVWKGRRLMTWRRQMKSSTPPIQCKNCCDR